MHSKAESVGLVVGTTTSSLKQTVRRSQSNELVLLRTQSTSWQNHHPFQMKPVHTTALGAKTEVLQISLLKKHNYLRFKQEKSMMAQISYLRVAFGRPSG